MRYIDRKQPGNRNTIRYTTYGALFGFVFPILSTLMDLLIQQLPLNVNNLLKVQASSPLHWVIDTAPFFLGLFASFAGRRQDNLEKLNRSLAERIEERDRYVSQLKELQNNLERQVIERTDKLSLKNIQLETAARVAKDVAGIRNVKKLLTQVCHLISNRFNYYHAGIFLLDEAGEYALLQAANSDGGQRMLQRRHRLKVGVQGIVGYVTQSGKPRIALDVGEDAVYFDNPDLPRTRSELALPLLVGDKVLGALDVQSIREADFKNDDIEVLQILADQIAVAIENARLFAENEAAMRAVHKAYGRMGREAWSQLLQARPHPGYISDRFGRISPISDWNGSRITQPGGDDQADESILTVPMKVRDQHLGFIRLCKPLDQGKWLEDEVDLVKALTDNLAVSLESARLYEETQRRAERERLVTSITTRMRASNDPGEILKTAVAELKKALNANQAEVHTPALDEDKKRMTSYFRNNRPEKRFEGPSEV